MNQKPDNNTLIKGRKHGLYTKIDIRAIDMRTKLGRYVRNLRAELEAFVGESNTATDLLISRIIYKTLKLSMYESNQLMNPESSEAAHYLPLSNSLRLDLIALAGMIGKTPSKVPRLQELLNNGK